MSELRTIHIAVLIVAISVVALWQPYWHTGYQENIIVTTSKFKVRDEALKAINFIHLRGEGNRNIMRDIKQEIYRWDYNANGETVYFYLYYGVISESTPYTVYDAPNDFPSIPKLYFAIIFLILIVLLLVKDIFRDELNKKRG